MGNCCYRCIRLIHKRRILRQYTALDSGTGPVYEAEDLFDDSDGDGLMSSSTSSSPSPAAITENEKLLLRSKNYAAIISSQKTFDEQIDKQLAEQEEKLKREEEELLRRRRARQQQAISSKPESYDKPVAKSNAEVPWTGGGDNSEWNVAGGEDDFDMFLDSIATRDKSSAGADDDEINDDDFVSAEPPS